MRDAGSRGRQQTGPTGVGRRWLARTSGLWALWLFLAAGSVWAQGETTLNLKDADIQSLIGTVSEITGKNFIVDPRVKGRVTVVSSHPMGKDEIYGVFLSILQVNGFSAVPSGNVIKIVPAATAKQGETPVATAARPGAGDELVTRVISVTNVNAAQLVPLLRPLVPQEGHLAAYAPGNVLIISDYAGNVDRLYKIVKRVDQSNNADIEVIPLQHASAGELVRLLTSLKQQNAKGEGGFDPVVLAADERTNSILMSGEPTMRLRYRTLISHLDTPVEGGGNTQVIYLNYATAPDLVNVLKSVVTTLTTAKPAGGGEGGATTQAAQVSIEADEATNALVITAPPDIVASLQAVIRQLDVRRAQVLVEAIIAEVSTDKSKELGVQWIVDGTPGGSGPVGVINFGGSGNGIVDIGTAIASSITPPIGDGLTLGLGRFDSGNINFAAVLHALAGDADTNILSTPSLVTLDNQEASIVVGQNVPFLTGSYTSVSSTGSSTPTNPFQTIERQDVGVTLKVKPQINAGDAVRLEIEQEVSSISASTTGAADLITNKRQIKTSVLVNDGQMLVLGGLIEDNLQESEQKVPGLGDVPLFGELFRYRKTDLGKKNLMVFLRPTILRDPALEAQVTGGKYNYIRARQMEVRERGVKLMKQAAPPMLPEYDYGYVNSAVPTPAPSNPAAPANGG